SPLLSAHGPLATAVIRDVSRRERDEAKFRTLVENIPAVTFFAPLDETAPELYVSPQIEALLGFSQREWVEDPVLWYRQLHPEDRPRWNGQFAPTCAAGTPFRDVYRFVAKDGRVVWVHGSANLVRDDEGRPLFLQGVAFDVTSIKQAEETLREEAHLAVLRAEISAAVTRSDPLPETLARCAAALAEHLGASGVGVWTCADGADRFELTARAGALGGVTEAAVRQRLGAAPAPPLAAYPLRIGDRRVGALALVMTAAPGAAARQALELLAAELALGIERKWAEEALRQLNADLERRVQERTEELARSMAELREKTDELEQFAYVASHDLREPLRTLVNWPQRLAQQYAGRLDAQADDWLNRIIGGARRMRQLIDDLSQYARVLRRDRAFAPVDCAAVAHEACANLQAALEECG